MISENRAEIVRRFMPISMAEFAGDRDEWIVLVFIPGTSVIHSYTIKGVELASAKGNNRYTLYPKDDRWRTAYPGDELAKLFPDGWSEWTKANITNKFMDGLADRGYGMRRSDGVWSDVPPQPRLEQPWCDPDDYDRLPD
ncbi:MAG: hypothetical protein AMS18_00420 [Gemmatimonas sp. SG8_17]|nr:MAG: hypothetical protein AMS18_00420 [Gemmatimonas sp. SG8_17]